MIYFIDKARVVDNCQIIPGYWQIVIEAPEIARSFKPGQFVNLQVDFSKELLLKRPFTVYKSNPEKGYIYLIYKIVGKGTEKLATIQTGKKLEILGPLGNGFEIFHESPVCFLAGGLGILPLYSLALLFKNKNFSQDLEIYWGAESKKNFFCKDDFLKAGFKKIAFASNDGSLGYKGLVTDLFKRKFLDKKPKIIYACGPQPMLKKLAELTRNSKIPVWVSLETRMACGYGVCDGCVVLTKNGYKKVCVDGPVFSAKEIIW